MWQHLRAACLAEAEKCGAEHPAVAFSYWWLSDMPEWPVPALTWLGHWAECLKGKVAEAEQQRHREQRVA